MTPMYLHARLKMSGHAPGKTIDGALGDLLSDLDQGINEL